MQVLPRATVATESCILGMDIPDDFSDFSESPSPPRFSPVESSSENSSSSATSSADEESPDDDICPQSTAELVNQPCPQPVAELANQPSPPSSEHAKFSSWKPAWTGFTIVGDNIDKTVRPRHQTLQSRTQSLHYFNSYAVLDRCDFSSLKESTSASLDDLSQFDVTELLPSPADLEQLHANLSVLVGRMLTQHVAAFQKYKSLVNNHIRHIYSEEMCRKSVVVSKTITQLQHNLSVPCLLMSGAFRDHHEE